MGLASVKIVPCAGPAFHPPCSLAPALGGRGADLHSSVPPQGQHALAEVAMREQRPDNQRIEPEGIAEEYRDCVKACENIDYTENRSIRLNNAAVTRMYQLVAKAEKRGAIGVAELLPLLDEPACAAWLAHQLVERATIDKLVEDRCFQIVEQLASHGGADAYGNQLWLSEWRAKKGR